MPLSARWWVLALAGGMALAGCNFPTYAPHVTPLALTDLPSPQVFVTPGMASPPSSLQPTSLPALTLVPPTVQPAFSTLCTIATVGLYLRNAPSSGAPDLELLPLPPELQWTGAEAQADGRTGSENWTGGGVRGGGA